MRIVKEHEERRNEILTNASDLFISKGYDKTTVNDILKAVNIAKGTFYHYFKSKEEVLDAVIMKIVEADMLQARRISKQKDLQSIDKIIEILLLGSTNEDVQKNEMISHFKNVENVIMKQRALEKSIEYMCPIIAEIIEEGNTSSEFNTQYPLESIQFLLAGIQLLLDERMNILSKDNIELRIDSFINIIFRVLGIDETKISRSEVKNRISSIFSN